MKNLILVSFFFLSNIIFSAELSEDDLIKLAVLQTPTLQKQHVQTLSIKELVEKNLQVYDWILNSGITKSNYNYTTSLYLKKSSEKYISISNKSKFGINTNFSVNSFKTKSYLGAANNYANATATVNIDLLKNFMGINDRTILSSLNESLEVAKLTEKIANNSYIQNTRKLYWTYVAKNMSLKIANKIFHLASRQVESAIKRAKSKVSDQGEVARMKSQKASKKALILNIKYEMELIKEKLGVLIPSIPSDFELPKYDLDSLSDNILKCGLKIQSKNKTPINFTNWDEIAKLKKIISKKQIKASSRDVLPDLTLTAEVSRYGDNSIDEIQKGSNNSTIGLNLKVPLGPSHYQKIETNKMIAMKKGEYESRDIMAKIRREHLQMKRSINFLFEVLKQEKQNSKQLRIVVKNSQMKFNQARITDQQLITDQELHLQSELTEISSKLMVLTAFLDYFSVFNNSPCALSKTKTI